MQNIPEIESPGPKNFMNSVTAKIIMLEFFLLLAGFIWAFFAKIYPWKYIYFTLPAIFSGGLAGLLLLSSGMIFYVIDLVFFKSRLKNLVEEDIYPIFREVKFGEIVLVALFSGFCEEFFFRGVLFIQAGLIISGVIFGLLHTPGRRGWFLGVWTALVGIYLAFLYQKTGNLAVPITAHVINNLLAISYIRYIFFRDKRDFSPEEA